MRVFVAILFLIISEVAMAEPLGEANSAFDEGNFGLASRLYGELASQGDRMAQFRLGVLYDEGKGIAKDSREAIRWYSVASAQGVPEAAYNLGRLYHDGRGIPQNYGRARRWYLVATGRGNTKAAVNLGVMNALGEGRPRDSRKAIEWFICKRFDDPLRTWG
jgi:TPR repeat protein